MRLPPREQRRWRVLPPEYGGGLPREDDRPGSRPYAGPVSALSAWWQRWRAGQSWYLVTALILTAVLVSGSYGEAHPNQPTDISVHGHHVPYTPNAALLLVAAATLALIWRRSHPVATLAVSTAAVTGYGLLGYVNGAALVGPPIALYSVALALTLRQAVVAAAVTLVALMGSTGLGNPFGPTGGGFFLIPAMVAAALFGGIAVSNRRAFFASIQARAEDEARRRVDEERLRIARELHDVVAHTMSTINVQASAAAMVLNERPEAAAEALAAIRSASKNGLRELRAILNVLRQADDADPTAPAPGLAQLDALVAGVTQAGLPTRLEISGDPAELPAGVDLAAYRIIQESLTNAIRHAGPATATVALAYLDDTLLIDVTDTGRGVPPAAARKAGPSQASSGHGLAGMRERAAAAGGTLQAGPAKTGPAKTSAAKTGPAKTSATGGFRVKAALPLRRPDGPGHRVAPEQAAAGQAAAEERARP